MEPPSLLFCVYTVKDESRKERAENGEQLKIIGNCVYKTHSVEIVELLLTPYRPITRSFGRFLNKSFIRYQARTIKEERRANWIAIIMKMSAALASLPSRKVRQKTV